MRLLCQRPYNRETVVISIFHYILQFCLRLYVAKHILGKRQ